MSRWGSLTALRTNLKSISRCLGLILLSCLLLSCGRSPESSFYSLSTVAGTPVARQGVAVGVGPITIATYLQQPPIATRITANQLKFDEFHRWAAPLKDNIGNVLISNLQIFLSSNRVYSYPSRENVDVRWQVVVDISQFDIDQRGRSVLRASWQLYRQPGNHLVQTQTSNIVSQMHGAFNYNNITASMSQNLKTLSQEIARKCV